MPITLLYHDVTSALADDSSGFAGPEAARLLNAACPLDLDPSAFPVGMCTRTLFAKAEIVLWRTGATAFHVEVWRSFAPYVVGHLTQASSDIG